MFSAICICAQLFLMASASNSQDATQGSLTHWPVQPSVNYTFQAVQGFFIQTDPATNETEAGAVPPRFGLIDPSSARWVKFQAEIAALQLKARSESHGKGKSVLYKVLFAGRHGEGYHNVAEAKYGTQAWDDYWSKLYTDGEIVWGPDPKLTPLGETQAEAVNAIWKNEIKYGAPLPQSAYSSPLTRSANTSLITFGDILIDRKVFPVKPLVVEYAREVYGEHTCDMRNTKSYIQSTFPEFPIEEGFTENDELWTTERETSDHVKTRVVNILDRIFESDHSTYVSVTAHGGWIGQLLVATNHRAYNLPTGGVIPIVIKATPVTT